ncbi:MAG TPA: hypothetical protein VGA21_02435 [Cyclobacteriaceae bacterium]|jgi:hypothetical protein
MKRISILILVTISAGIFQGCIFDKDGCTSACASNFDSSADNDDGSCTGCTDPTATNYCPGADFDNGTCILPCEANQSGKVYFINNSNSNSTYDVIWDGVKIFTVAPGQQSSTITVTANIQHTLVFRYTNTSNNACTPSTPVIPQCETWWFNCTG